MAEQKQPMAIRLVQWCIRIAVVMMVILMAVGLWTKITPPGDAVERAPEEEVVQLKGKVASLELELEKAREEIERMRREAAERREEERR